MDESEIHPLKQKYRCVIKDIEQNNEAKFCFVCRNFEKFILENREHFDDLNLSAADQATKISVLLDLSDYMNRIFTISSKKEITNGSGFFEEFLLPLLNIISFCFSFCNDRRADDENEEFSELSLKLYKNSVAILNIIISKLSKSDDHPLVVGEEEVETLSKTVEKFSDICRCLNNFNEDKVLLSTLKSLVLFFNEFKIVENLKDRSNFDPLINILCDFADKLVDSFICEANMGPENNSKNIYMTLKLLANLVESLSNYLGGDNVSVVLNLILKISTKIIALNFDLSLKLAHFIEHFTTPLIPLIEILMTERQFFEILRNCQPSAALLQIFLVIIDSFKKANDFTQSDLLLDHVFCVLPVCNEIILKQTVLFGYENGKLVLFYERCCKSVCSFIISDPSSKFCDLERIVWKYILDSHWISAMLAADCLVFIVRYAKPDICLSYCKTLYSILNNNVCCLTSKETERISNLLSRLVKCLDKSHFNEFFSSAFMGDLNPSCTYLPLNLINDDQLLLEFVEKLEKLLKVNSSTATFLFALKCLEKINFDKISETTTVYRIVDAVNEAWNYFPRRVENFTDVSSEIRLYLIKVSKNLSTKCVNEALIFNILNTAVVSELQPTEELTVLEFLRQVAVYQPSDRKQKDMFDRSVAYLFQRYLISRSAIIFDAALHSFNYFAKKTEDTKILPYCVPETQKKTVLQFMERNLVCLSNSKTEVSSYN